ncbi:MAG: hypothetical protein ACE367_20680 [Acidimicrobiales bacterium]
MELAVLWVVLIAIVAFVLGVVGGWFATRRVRASGVPAQAPLAKAAGASSADTTDSEAEAESEPGPAGADMAAAARLERDERARYAEIIGIETENASLRAVAARVPGLERRIRELEGAIEEHTGRSEPVLDLTGPEPVVRTEGADVTRR